MAPYIRPSSGHGLVPQFRDRQHFQSSSDKSADWLIR